MQLYNETGKGSTYLKDANLLPELKDEYEWLKEVGSQCLQFAVKKLQTAYENFFTKCKLKKQGKFKGKCGFPRFKKKFAKQSFRVPQNVKLVDNKLVIPKFLEGIPVLVHRELEGIIKFATISKTATNQYYVSITTERDIQPLPQVDTVVGMDLNVKAMVDNNGNKIENPRPEKEYKQRLRMLHKQVQRRKKTRGKNYTKAKLKLAELKQHIHNIREDFLHKLSTRIINENQVICVEDLSVEDMVQKVSPEKMPRWKQKKLHRDILDCGFSSLVQKLIYKAAWYGREVIRISRWYPSSQICHNCGWRYEDLKPKQREWSCWNCFESHDRDINAAENILEEGLRMRTCAGIQGIAYCPDVRPSVKPGLLVG